MPQLPSEQPGADDAGAMEPLPDGQRQLVLVKQGQRYIFRYAPGDEAQMLESLIELARDPESELTWFDAAVLSHQMGQRLGKQLDHYLKSS